MKQSNSGTVVNINDTINLKSAMIKALKTCNLGKLNSYSQEANAQLSKHVYNQIKPIIYSILNK